ncbi:MAG: DUF721 domain-containing protein [Actinomycetota bacterium]|nr:DUF721 domain-containing protein [Actinomycetota bacterium]
MTWRPLADGGGRDPRRVKEILDAALKRAGGESASVLAMITAKWPDVVGDDVAQRCVPVALDGPRLVVRVDDPAWATQMRLLTTQILGGLHQIDGAQSVTGIEVRAGRRVPSGGAGPRRQDPPPPRQASPGNPPKRRL